jgi:hypothetical protein
MAKGAINLNQHMEVLSRNTTAGTMPLCLSSHPSPSVGLVPNLRFESNRRSPVPRSQEANGLVFGQWFWSSKDVHTLAMCSCIDSTRHSPPLRSNYTFNLVNGTLVLYGLGRETWVRNLFICLTASNTLV